MTATIRNLFLGCALTTSVFGLQINPPQVEWQRSFGGNAGDQLRAVRQVADGGYVLGGFSNGSTNETKTSAGFGGMDYWVVRTDASGNRVWDKSFGGARQDYLRGLQTTTDGGFVLGGHSNSDANGNKTSPHLGSGVRDLGDYWVVRLNAGGDKLWDKSYGGTNDDVLFAVQQTTDGGYVLGGYSASPPGGNKTAANYGQSDFWVVRLDAAGDVIWDRSFGGDDFDILYALQQTSDGGFIVGGVTRSGASGNKTSASFGSEDIWVLRLDSDGNKTWEASFGGDANDGLYSLQQLSDGGFVLGGYSSSTNNSGNKTSPNYGVADFWVVRLDGAGNKLWDRSFGGNRDDQLLIIRQTAEGGFLLGGYSYSRAEGNKASPNFSTNDPPLNDYWLLRLNSDGHKIWEQVYGGTGFDSLQALDLTTDGGLIIGGDSRSGAGGNKTSPNHGEQDYWIVRLGPDVLSVPPRLRTVPQTLNELSNSGFRLFLQGVSNVSYVVECREGTAAWIPLATNLLQSAESEIIDAGAINFPHRLYRARLAD